MAPAWISGRRSLALVLKMVTIPLPIACASAAMRVSSHRDNSTECATHDSHRGEYEIEKRRREMRAADASQPESRNKSGLQRREVTRRLGTAAPYAALA